MPSFLYNYSTVSRSFSNLILNNPISGFRFFRSWIFLFYFRILTRRFWSPSCWKRLATLSPRSSRPSSSWFDGMPWTWLRLCPDITPTPTSYSSQCKTSDFAIFPDGFLKPVPGFSGKNLNFALLYVVFAFWAKQSKCVQIVFFLVFFRPDSHLMIKFELDKGPLGKHYT